MQRAILEIILGPMAGETIEVRPGALTRIGRTTKADFAVPQDSFLSGIHFGVGGGEAGYYVRDLESSNGTFLNGSKVSQALLGDGDRIRAGDTTFVVHIEGPGVQTISAPAAAAPEESAEPKSPETGRVMEILRSQPEPLFAILDAARDQKLINLLSDSKVEFRSLYDGKSASDLALLAPYLVRLPLESSLLEKLVFEGWGKSWGVYLTCGLPLLDLRQHLRHFLMVEIEGAKPAYFRFYDPRVLRTYLPTCTAAESQQFFGPISCYFVESMQPGTVLAFRSDQQGANQQTLLYGIAESKIPPRV